MKVRDHIPGFSVVLVVAVFSYYLSTVHASFNAPVISIVIGMLLGNIVGDKDFFERGTEAALKIFLPFGIALYGSQMVLRELPWVFLLAIFLVSAGLFGLTMLMAKIFNVKRKLGVLLASGLSICGASAIAIMSPLIGAKREETATSILSVMMLGLTGMVFYPIVYDLLALTRDEFGFLTGTTLPMVGQVKIAAAGLSPECLSSALRIKLMRTSFLFFLVVTSIFPSVNGEKRVKIPWYVIAFIVMAVGANVTKAFAPVLEYFNAASSFCLTAALAAIGFSVDFDSVVEEGIAPLGIIFFPWGVVILLIYLVRNLF